MLNIITLSVIKLGVIMLIVIILSVVGAIKFTVYEFRCKFYGSTLKC
jgi:hypothetical protein